MSSERVTTRPPAPVSVTSTKDSLAAPLDVDQLLYRVLTALSSGHGIEPPSSVGLVRPRQRADVAVPGPNGGRSNQRANAGRWDYCIPRRHFAGHCGMLSPVWPGRGRRQPGDRLSAHQEHDRPDAILPLTVTSLLWLLPVWDGRPR